MNVVVLGATGFVGQHLVAALLTRGHQVTAVARSATKAQSLSWFGKVLFTEADLYAPHWEFEKFSAETDALVDLVWPGLPNYSKLFHFEQNLPSSYRMLKSLVSTGCKRIISVGTCLEYGLQNGELSADSETHPDLPYGLAKDSLRRSLKMLQNELPFSMQWARLFYAYGPGQNLNSLLPQLDAAMQRGDATFKMSGGEQLRDFLTIESAADQLARLVEQPEIESPVNICSGRPVSVRRLVEERIKAAGASIRLELGYYPYPSYEPMAFWGQPHAALVSDVGTAGSNSHV